MSHIPFTLLFLFLLLISRSLPSQDLSEGEKFIEIGENFNQTDNLDSAIYYNEKGLAWYAEQEEWYTYIKDQQKLILYFEQAENYQVADSLSYINWALAQEHISPLNLEEAEIYGYAASNVAFAHYYARSYPEAIESFRKAFEVSERLYTAGRYDSANVETYASWYAIAGICYRNIGDHTQAIRYYRNALALHRQNKETPPELFRDEYYNLAIAFKSISQIDSALSYFTLSEDMALLGDRESQKLSLLDIYRGKSLAYQVNGMRDSALHFAKKSEALLAPEESNSMKALTYEVLGSSYTQNKQWKEAEYFLKKSLHINARESEDYSHYEEHGSLKSLGELYEAQGEYESALFYYEQALALNSTNPKAPTLAPADFPFKNRTLEVLLGKIRCNRLLPQKEFSPQVSGEIKLAQGLIRELRNSFQAEGSKLRLAKLAHQVCEESLLLLGQQENQDEYLSQIFENIEANKAMLLYAALQDQEARASLPDELREKERRFKRDIAYFEKKLFDDAGNESMQSQLFLTQQHYKHFIDSLEQRFPDYYREKYRTPLTTLAKLQDQLEGNQTFIQYFVGDSHLFVLGIQAQKQVIHSLPYSDSLAQIIRDYMLALSSGDHLDSPLSGEILVQHAFYLYTQLLSPLLNQLPQDPSVLIISPDNILSFLPFEALLSSQAPPKWKYGDLDYLVTSYPVSYTHSGTHWLGQQEELHQMPPRNWMGFAPTFSESQLKNTLQPLAYNQLLTRDGSYQLPYAHSEVTQIADLLSGKGLLEQRAQESHFHKQAKNYQVLHLATHGIIEDQEPMYSKLVFAPESDSSFDGFLHAYEIYNMQLPANLVVLSACNTGIGKMEKGEGIMSLSRAFFYAGVKSLLMSLWSVSDESTSQLMLGFYEGIRKGYTKDVALQQAKVNYLDQQEIALKSHPYFWAGFVLKGNTEPISVKSTFTPLKILGILILLLGLLGWGFVRRSGRSN